jgi:CheY-like chemotaxis protein
MTFVSIRQPAIALVDDDYHSARLMMRTLEAEGALRVSCLADPERAVDQLGKMAQQEDGADFMTVVDLKSSSTATRDFVRRLKDRAPALMIVAIAPSLDRDVRSALLDAGAAAVFERHSDIELYRREAASIVDYWARMQRLDRTGT